jgi:acetoin utilization deacetylase AcuC-like enzyme
MEKPLGFLFDDCYLRHDPGSRHPESPKRLLAIKSALDSHSGLDSWQRLEPRPAQQEELELVHHPAHVERVEKAARRAPAYLDPDTVVSTESYRTGLYAAGGVLECVDAICKGNLIRGFAFVRPPGHHAEPNKAMGFCLFNNVALAAAFARRRYGFERIAIVDVDLHHGNGTQAAFYEDPGVLYISTHQYPFYPGTGNFDEVGLKEGKGYTLNLPLPSGTGDETFAPLYTHVVAPILEQYKPQLILVSTGFDAYFQDPLGGLSVTRKGYASAAASLIRAARLSCEGKICFVLEGGYSVEGLQECTKAVLLEMEETAPPQAVPVENQLFHEISEKARRSFGDLWHW